MKSTKEFQTRDTRLLRAREPYRSSTGEGGSEDEESQSQLTLTWISEAKKTTVRREEVGIVSPLYLWRIWASVATFPSQRISGRCGFTKFRRQRERMITAGNKSRESISTSPSSEFWSDCRDAWSLPQLNYCEASVSNGWNLSCLASISKNRFPK